MPVVDYEELSADEKQKQLRDEKVAGLLENIFGLKLPSELLSSAYSIILTEYSANHECSRERRIVS